MAPHTLHRSATLDGLGPGNEDTACHGLLSIGWVQEGACARPLAAW
jgi:hypothetical protein